MTEFCGKTKLLKLLFELDFRHFKETGSPVTGLRYFAWEKGPVPPTFFQELSGKMGNDLSVTIAIYQIDGFQKIIPRKQFDLTVFSEREIRLLKDISYIYKHAKADEMVESTHLKNSPWEKTKREKGLKKEIDYFLALDDDPTSLSFEEANERVQEREEMYRAFGSS